MAINYRREIDGLRTLAVLPVIFFHAGFQIFSGGFVGVDIFFVISGYLITSTILAEKQAGKFSLVSFYERRARRILPALFFVMLVCLPFARLWLLPDEMKAFSQSLVAVSTFSSNILFLRESGYFDTAAELKPLLHTWSLSVEEQYYLLFPIFLLVTWKLSNRLVIGMLFVIAVISLSAAQWGSINQPAAAFYLLPTRGWELLIGAFLAFYFIAKERNNTEVGKTFSQTVSLIGFLLINYAIFSFDKSTPFPSIYTLIPTLGSALIILFASPQTLVGRLLGSRLFVGAGLISYSAYLWHQPLFAFARIATFNNLSGAILIILVIFSFVAAYLTWRFIEQPFRSKAKIGSIFFFVVAICSSFLIIAFGLFGHATNGFKSSYEKNVNERLQLIKSLGKERGQLVRTGICHYTSKANTRGIEDFLRNWDCFTDKNAPELKNIPLIVTGDSHSADKVISLKLNGFVPLQIGGAGCSINPKTMTKECTQIFEKLYKLVVNNNYYKYIAIANKFEPEDLSLDSITETINYWERFNKKIILFTGMPDFPMFKEKFSQTLPLKADFKIAELSERRELMDLLTNRGVYVVNTREIFCSISKNCDYKINDDILLIDPGHLSKYGAKYFGEMLFKNDRLFKSFVEDKKNL